MKSWTAMRRTGASIWHNINSHVLAGSMSFVYEMLPVVSALQRKFQIPLDK